MTIKTKIDFKEYLKLMFVLTYQKSVMILFTIFGIGMLTSSLLYFTGLAPLNTDQNAVIRLKPDSRSEAFYMLAVGVLFVIYIPFSAYRASKKSFDSNERLQEEMLYEFSDEGIKTRGESFYTQVDWAKTYKIKELKNWFLIYHSKQVANLIPKVNLSEEEVKGLRGIFRRAKNVKLELKG